ncbi:MAG: hypothetical protein ABIO39_03695 [Caulobacteraceae bacterium]
MRYRLPARSWLLPLLALMTVSAGLAACASGDPPPRELDANGQPVRRRAQLSFLRHDDQPAEIARVAPPPKPVKAKRVKAKRAVAPPAPKPEIVAAAPPPPPAQAAPIQTAPVQKPPASEAPAPPPAKAAVPPPPPAPDTARARVEPNVAKPKVLYAGQVVPVAQAEARRRVVAYLSAKGYSFQQEDQTAGPLLTDPMLSGPQSIDHLASCGGGGALAHPILHSIELEVQFAPEGAGTRVTVGTLFTEVRQGKVGKGMSKIDCKSRGSLETDVMRAAAGG